MGDAIAGIPPRTKRQLKIAAFASLVVGWGPILGNYVELWTVVLIAAVIAAAVFIPLIYVLKREKRELGEPRHRVRMLNGN